MYALHPESGNGFAIEACCSVASFAVHGPELHSCDQQDIQSGHLQIGVADDNNPDFKAFMANFSSVGTCC